MDDVEDVGEDQIINRRLGVVNKIQEVDELVRSENVDPDTLDAPWYNDFHSNKDTLAFQRIPPTFG